jgi:hypothetical protein
MADWTKHFVATRPIELAGTPIFLQLAQVCAQMSLKINCVGSMESNVGQQKSPQRLQSILLIIAADLLVI